MEKDKIMKQLVERFLDGATTNAEERQLYDYFAGPDVAPGLEQYRKMFNWYAGGMAGPLPGEGTAAEGRTRTLRMRIKTAIGIAAAILLVAGAATGYRKYMQTKLLYDTYEGSYIVRNGKKITDIKTILPELRRVERDTKTMVCRYKGLGKMSPTEIFKMMEEENKHNDHMPTI